MARPPGAIQEADVRNRAEGDGGGEAPPKGEFDYFVILLYSFISLSGRYRMCC